jgi:hypothetical protein
MALTAQDRLEIMDVLAKYCLALDDSDIDTYVTLWADDAVFEHLGGKSVGRDEIRARGRFLIDSGRAGGTPAHLRHFVGLPLLGGDGDRATAVTLSVILDYDPEKKIRVPLVGSYTDEFTKKDGRWRIQHRVTRADLNGRGD